MIVARAPKYEVDAADVDRFQQRRPDWKSIRLISMPSGLNASSTAWWFGGVWSERGSERSLAHGAAPLVEQRSCCPLRIACRTKFATFEAVESAFGGEEVKSALVTCDDSGCPVPDFNDVGFGHACSFAEMPALPSDSWSGSIGLHYAGISDRLRSPQRRSGGSCACAYRPRLACHLVSCSNPRQHNLPHQISGRPTNWSTKWVSNFAWETWQLFYPGTVRQRNCSNPPRWP
jgi:hypothetical protein